MKSSWIKQHANLPLLLKAKSLSKNLDIAHGNTEYLPITVKLKDKETADRITAAAKVAKILNKKIRASRTRGERKKIQDQRAYFQTGAGKEQTEIYKRTEASEWVPKTD